MASASCALSAITMAPAQMGPRRFLTLGCLSFTEQSSIAGIVPSLGESRRVGPTAENSGQCQTSCRFAPTDSSVSYEPDDLVCHFRPDDRNDAIDAVSRACCIRGIMETFCKPSGRIAINGQSNAAPTFTRHV